MVLFKFKISAVSRDHFSSSDDGMDSEDYDCMKQKVIHVQEILAIWKTWLVPMLIISVLAQVKLKQKTSQGHHLEVIYGLTKD